MKKEKDKTSRRDFLKLAAAGAPAAAVVTLSAKQASSEEIELGSGIQNTEHVLKYYETARF
jgi:ABC-type nitrate/sulfonate/bicarbonate transport system substrate-binding protein